MSGYGIDKDQQEIEGLVADNKRLYDALADTLEGMEELISYVDAYFIEKWGLQEYIERARVALGGKE